MALCLGRLYLRRISGPPPQFNPSAGAFHRILKVARTIVDLAHSPTIGVATWWRRYNTGREALDERSLSTSPRIRKTS